MRTLRREVLSVVCPCFNEAEVVRPFYQKLKGTLDSLEGLRCRILFVDDGSGDDTLARLNEIAAEDPAVSVYSLSRNFGHQVALTAGLDAARGDAVVMMDSDLQHPPSLIPKMVELWRQGNDVVSAVRKCTADETWFKRLSSWAFYRLINWSSETPIYAGAADFCLLSRRAHKSLRQLPERHRFLRGMVSWIGFRRAFVEYEAPARAAGKSKYTLRRMLRLASNAVFSFSAAPLQSSARVGMLAIAAGLLYLVYVVGRYLLWHDLVPGWSSVVCCMVILGGLQLFFIGLIGEYLARIFEEVKRRPLYLLKQKPARSARRLIGVKARDGAIPLKVGFRDGLYEEDQDGQRAAVYGLVDSALFDLLERSDGSPRERGKTIVDASGAGRENNDRPTNGPRGAAARGSNGGVPSALDGDGRMGIHSEA